MADNYIKGARSAADTFHFIIGPLDAFYEVSGKIVENPRDKQMTDNSSV